MEPAASIIKSLGGPKAVATRLSVALTAPYRWQSPEDKGGTGGEIPRKYRADLIALATEKGVKLSKIDFVVREPDDETSHDVILKTRTTEEHA